MGKWLKSLIVNFIARLLPKRGKRIIFVVMCYLIWSSTTDKDQIRYEIIEINNKLNLCRDEEALRFAIELKDILFSLDDFKCATTLPTKDLKTKLIGSMPDWLKYDNESNIESELQTVFNIRYRHEDGHLQSGI